MKPIVLLMMASTMGAATFPVRVFNQTNAQFVLQYTQTGSCTIEVSESPTYSPVVHDVNATLFSGANTDTSRTDAIIIGDVKVIPIGKRKTELASDSLLYSRALQVYTPHYWRITCGANVTTGYGHTTNLITGSTRNEVPVPNPAVPGGWLIPSTPDVRNYKIVDPQTGALLTRISVASDKIGSSKGVFDGFGGITRPCNNTLHTAPGGIQGYFCVFWHADDQRGSLYFIIPATGIARNLGYIGAGGNIIANPSIDSLGRVFVYCPGCSPAGMYLYTYNGDYSEQFSASFDGGTLYSANTTGGTSAALAAFNPAFNPVAYNYDCGPAYANAGQYSGFFCPVYPGPSQDVYGWIGIWYGGDGRMPYDPACPDGNACPRVVGSINLHDFGCVLHNWSVVSNGGGVIAMNTKQESLTCTLGGSAAVSWWNFLVDPMGLAPVVDIYWPYGGHDQYDGPLGRVTELGGWGYVFGVPLINFENLPLVQLSDTLFFAGAQGRSFGNTISKHPSWQQDPNQITPVEKQWFNDASMFSGGNLIAGDFAGQLVSGTTQVWKYTSAFTINRKQVETLATNGSASLRDISKFGSTINDSDIYTYCVAYLPNECRLGSAAGDIYLNTPVILNHTVTDISHSNPAVVTSVNHQLGVYTSSPVQLWGATGPGWSAVNAPFYETWIDNDHFSIPVDSTSFGTLGGTIQFGSNRCNGGDDPPVFAIDMCVANIGTWDNVVGQHWMGTTETNSQAQSRYLTRAISPYRLVYGASTGKPIPDGSQVLFMVGVGISGFPDVNMWMAKNPPLTQLDSVNRTEFHQYKVNVPAGPVGTNNAIIRFGYLEYGTSTNYYCTTRAEECVAGTTVPIFAFPSDGTGNTEAGLTGTACSSGCTINIPGLSGRLMYYQVVYRNVIGGVMALGDPQIVSIK